MPKVADTGYGVLGQRRRGIGPLVILGCHEQSIDLSGIETSERQVEICFVQFLQFQGE